MRGHSSERSEAVSSPAPVRVAKSEGVAVKLHDTVRGKCLRTLVAREAA